MAGRWTPGHRRAPAGQRDRFGKNVFLVATVERNRIMAVAQPPEEAHRADDLDDGLTPDSFGPDIAILLKREDSRAGALPIPLSSLTLEELDTLEAFFTRAFAAARPIVTERDRIAEEAAANGDDTYYRRHRSSPRLSEFPGKV